MLKLSKRNLKQSEPLNKILDEIKKGDVSLKERLIGDYRPFILKCVSKSSGKFIDTYNSEEYSVGLMAFNEAIESYKSDQKAHFLTFAEMVIDRRVKNYMKKESKHAKVISFTNLGTNNEQVYHSMQDDSIVLHFEKFEVRSEIEMFKKALGDYGIELSELLEASPKHIDTRKTCIKIARLIVDNDEMYQKFVNKKILPVKDILVKFRISERTLERNRKYIIASCLVLISGLDIVKGFLLDLEGRG